MNKKSLIILISVIALLIVECIAFVCIKYSNDSGSDFHVHRYAYTQIRPQTCNQNGEKKGKCICGDVVIIETPKLQHSFKDNICGLCEINYFDTCDHEWNTTVCTEVKTCLNCGLINIDDLQHSFVDNACQFCYLQATSNEYFAFTKHGSNYSVKPKNKQDLPSNIVLPSTYNNRPVDLIETEAFLDCDKIVSLVIPQSIKTIKADAFKDCNNLKSVVIPNTSIQYSISISATAFDKTAIETAVIPASVSSVIPKKAIKKLTITSGSLEDYAFENSYLLKDLIIGNDVKYLAWCAFQNCFALETIVCGKQLSNFSSDAFKNCNKIKSIVISSKFGYFSTQSFTNPSAIEVIKYSGTREMWDALTTNGNWDEFGAEIICNYKYV